MPTDHVRGQLGEVRRACLCQKQALAARAACITVDCAGQAGVHEKARHGVVEPVRDAETLPADDARVYAVTAKVRVFLEVVH